MVKFQSLLSSSSGNATFITDDTTCILIDCGASLSYIESCLSRLLTGEQTLSAIFITHAHTDHILSCGALSRKHNIPLYATEETFLKGQKQLGFVENKNLCTIKPNDDIVIGTLTVHAFSISHDIEGAVSYTVTDGETKFGIATDSGVVTDEMVKNLTGCDTVIVEANHDVTRLKNGPYPYPLKIRILGDFGHLSNETCANLCVTLAKSGTHAFWLGHLSEKNNLPSLAYQSVYQVFLDNGITVGSDVSLNVIPKLWIEGLV